MRLPLFFFILLLCFPASANERALAESPAIRQFMHDTLAVGPNTTEQQLIATFGKPEEIIRNKKDSFVIDLKAEKVYRFPHPEYATVYFLVGVKAHKVSAAAIALDQGSRAHYEKLVNVKSYWKDQGFLP